MFKPIFAGLREAKSQAARGMGTAARSPQARNAVRALGGVSMRGSNTRTAEQAMRVGKRRMKYAAGTAAGLSIYGAAMSNTKYNKRYSSGRGGLNPQSSGGYA